MIILDTSILSDLMRTTSSAHIERWINTQPRESIWTTSICLYEIRFGLARLPAGARKNRLEQAFEDVIARDIEARIAPFDTEAAEATAELAASRRSSGTTIDLADTLIAGTAPSRNARVATLNARHFADLVTGVVDLAPVPRT